MATVNGGNYARIQKQRFTVPAILCGISIPAGTLSGLLAPHVGNAGFYDMWLGGLSVISGLGAVIVFCLGVGGIIEGIQEMLRD
jgi:hypothetical protein